MNDKEQRRIELSNRNYASVKEIFEYYLPPGFVIPEWGTRFCHIYNNLLDNGYLKVKKVGPKPTPNK